MPNGVSLCIEHHREIHEGKDKLSLKTCIIMNTTGPTKFKNMEDCARYGEQQGGAEHLEQYIKENR
jgi:hypothetical protein